MAVVVRIQDDFFSFVKVCELLIVCMPQILLILVAYCVLNTLAYS